MLNYGAVERKDAASTNPLNFVALPQRLTPNNCEVQESKLLVRPAQCALTFWLSGYDFQLLWLPE